MKKYLYLLFLGILLGVSNAQILPLKQHTFLNTLNVVNKEFPEYEMNYIYGDSSAYVVIYKHTKKNDFLILNNVAIKDTECEINGIKVQMKDIAKPYFIPAYTGHSLKKNEPNYELAIHNICMGYTFSLHESSSFKITTYVKTSEEKLLAVMVSKRAQKKYKISTETDQKIGVEN